MDVDNDIKGNDASAMTATTPKQRWQRRQRHDGNDASASTAMTPV
jgi:hypothetical protein